MKGVIILAVVGGIVACNDGGTDRDNGSLPPVTLLSPDSANHMTARFSPDGSRLFWWEPDGVTNQLWTADAKLGSPTKVAISSTSPEVLLWSPDGSTIAAPSSASGLIQVALISVTGEVRPFIGGTYSVPIGWHPDGDRLTYFSTAPSASGAVAQSYVSSVTRGGTMPLLPDERSAAIGTWSPDGSRVGYVTFGDGRSYLWVADSSGRNARQLTTDGFENPAQRLSWFSPDGSALAFESRRTGTSDVWVAPLDGTPPRQLTRDVRNDLAPAWSPDGKWIAFVSDRGKQTDIWVVPAAGGEEIRITNDPAVEELMQWLPDSRLAFLTGEPQGSVWSMAVTGGQSTKLTPDSIVAGRFTLSPDDSQMALLVERGGGNSDLVVMPTAGGAMRVLVNGGGTSDFTWSPDGSKIVFSSDRGGTPDIWMVEVASASLRQMTNWPEAESQPIWDATGTGIYFVSTRDAKLADVWRVAVTGGEPTRMTRNGAINSITARLGDSTLFGAIIAADGNWHTVRIEPDGTVVPIWTRGNSIPWDALPGADSLLILAPMDGGGFSYRIIAADGSGEGAPLLAAGDDLSATTRDWAYVVHLVKNGSTRDIVLHDRKAGTSRRLTNNSIDERGPEVTDDGKTVIYRQRRDVRRIAIADLSKVLTTKTAGR